VRGLSAIIPSKNAANLIPCLTAVRKQQQHDVSLLVVDDGLTPAQQTEVYYLQAAVINGQKPFCFAGNVNLGIEAAGSDDVIILNDDAILQTPGGFTAMQKAAEEHPEFGLIGATCNNVGNVNQWPKGIGLREEPRMVCFVCAFIPRRTIDAVGLLDERFVGYGLDDDDYCLRVRQA